MISLVTIAFSGDLDLLRYQAQSLARMAHPDAVTDINLIINDVNEDHIRRRLEDIRPAYGPHAPKVRIFGGDELLLGMDRKRRRSLTEWLYVENRYRLPFVASGGWRGGNGYRMQQALKLASARITKTDRVLILDGKNIFLRDLDPAEFFDDEDRGLSTQHAPTAEFHQKWLNESLKVMGVNKTADDIAFTTGFATPNPINRQLMLRVLDEVAESHGSVQALFASKLRATEFMLLFASCIRNEGSIDRFYGEFTGEHLGIWKEYPSEMIDKVIAEAEAAPSPTFGVHRKALKHLNEDQRSHLIALFETRGLDLTPLLARV
ncbi:DUF6492 family protein [Ruegeria halocynthiae]|uniref:DUF6492 family protein n=1 Tax=Ruegeria halocynthiae TaxID=985054 RepID=UPI00055D3EEE|nr:DUF6492 family protein [Ruegeria halocynthiae]